MLKSLKSIVTDDLLQSGFGWCIAIGAVAHAAGMSALGGMLCVTTGIAALSVAATITLKRDTAAAIGKRARCGTDEARRSTRLDERLAARDRLAGERVRLTRENAGLAEQIAALQTELVQAHEAMSQKASTDGLSQKVDDLGRQLQDSKKLTQEWAARSHGLSQERDALKQRASELAAKGRRVVADRDHWQAEANRLGAELTAASSSDEKFKATKRAFAQHFHPNNGGAEGLEKTVRTVIFTQFWPVLEDIERGARAQH